MTEQTQGNKEWLARIKNDQGILVSSLIMQALNAARAINASLSIWSDKGGGLMVSAGDKRKRSYVRFGDDIKNSEIDDLVDIVEWLLNGAPEEKDEAEDDD